MDVFLIPFTMLCKQQYKARVAASLIALSLLAKRTRAESEFGKSSENSPSLARLYYLFCCSLRARSREILLCESSSLQVFLILCSRCESIFSRALLIPLASSLRHPGTAVFRPPLRPLSKHCMPCYASCFALCRSIKAPVAAYSTMPRRCDNARLQNL